jgi:hypothetical protein
MPVLHASHASPPMPDEPRDWNEAVPYPGHGPEVIFEALPNYAALHPADLRALAKGYEAIASEARAFHRPHGTPWELYETQPSEAFDAYCAGVRADHLAFLCRTLADMHRTSRHAADMLNSLIGPRVSAPLFGEPLREQVNAQARRRRLAIALDVYESLEEPQRSIQTVAAAVAEVEGVKPNSLKAQWNRLCPSPKPRKKIHDLLPIMRLARALHRLTDEW